MSKRKIDELEPIRFKSVGKEGVEGAVDGPVLVAFPGIDAPADTTFYSLRTTDQSRAKLARQRIVVGETEKVEFSGRNFGPEAPKGHCRYMIGIRKRGDSAIHLKEANVFTLNRTVKALKSIDQFSNPAERFAKQKSALGEAFGTKKVKQQLKALERNAVDTTNLEGIADTLNEEIEQQVRDLPSKEEIQKNADAERPIPPHDLNATTPEEIYKLADLVSADELASMPEKAIIHAKSEERASLLPFRHSTYVNNHLEALLKPSKKNRPHIRLVLYLDYLLAFHALPKSKLAQGTGAMNAPALVMEKLLERFCVKSGKGYSITPVLKDKLLCWILVIALTLDQYVTETKVLADDLGIKQTRIQELFKSVGAKIQENTVEGNKVKKAVLVAPLTFPAPRRGPSKK